MRYEALLLTIISLMFDAIDEMNKMKSSAKFNDLPAENAIFEVQKHGRRSEERRVGKELSVPV